MQPRWYLLLLAAAAWVLGPASAFADEDVMPQPEEPGYCASDDDCPEGTYCLLMFEEDCAVAPPCAEGDESCVPAGDGADCEVRDIGECVPDWLHECETDADCGPGLLCTVFTEEVCSQFRYPEPCDVDEGCIEPEDLDMDCEVLSTAICLPPYLGPCKSDEDCGEGFACRLEEHCWCEGSDGDPSPEGEDGQECGCETLDSGWCELLPVSCEEDSECPADWTCEALTHGEPDTPIDCPVDENGDPTCELPEPSPESEEPELFCVPPYWFDLPDFGDVINQPGDGERDEDPGDGDGERDEDPGDDDGDPADGGDEDPKEKNRLFGCSSAAGSSGLPAALVLLLGGLAWLGRRRVTC